MTARRAAPVLGALLGTALLGTALVTAQLVPPPGVQEPESALAVAVPAADKALGCPGPPTTSAAPGAGGGELADAGAVAPATSLRVATSPLSPLAGGGAAGGGGAPSLEVTPLPDGGPSDLVEGADPAQGGAAAGSTDDVEVVEGTPLGPGGALGATTPGSSASSVVASPVDGAEPLVAGTASALAGEGDLRGLVTTPCVAASDEAWLVGGSTTVGDSTRLVVANPGTTAASVRTSVLLGAAAAEGADAAGDAAGDPAEEGAPPAVPEFSVAPGEQRSVLLEGVAPGVSSVAVQVSSEGSDVAAWLVTTSLRGLVPQGVDVVTPGDAPSARQVVPGVTVGEGDAPPVLRLAAPGETPVLARWQLGGREGPVVPEGTPLAATVPPGAVVDVPLTGLPRGTYAVAVDADGPLAAAVGTSTTSSADVAGDHAWVAAARPLLGDVLVAVPETTGVATELVLHAPLDRDGAAEEPSATVAVLDGDGRVRPTGPLGEVAPLAPGASAVLDIAAVVAASGATAPVALLVSAPEDGGLVGAVRSAVPTDAGGRLVSVHALPPPPASTGELRVSLGGSP